MIANIKPRARFTHIRVGSVGRGAPTSRRGLVRRADAAATVAAPEDDETIGRLTQFSIP